MTSPNTQLSEHFALSELTVSQAAARAGIRNVPPDSCLENLRRLACTLEQVRLLLGGRPIIITSGYRSPEVNRLIGGAAQSAHLQGLAADFICPGYGTPQQICQALLDSPIRFDQLIYEGTWVHFAVPASGLGDPRRDVLTAIFTSGQGTRYAKGILA